MRHSDPQKAAPLVRSNPRPARRRLPARPFFEALEERLLLSTYVVNNLADGPLAAGLTGTLRWAVTQANLNVGSDTIIFETGLNGTVNLTQGTLRLTDSLGTTTILGSGAGAITVRGNNASSDFIINPGVNAAISGLTITRGNASTSGGGGIQNGGNLRLTGTVVTGNVAQNQPGGGIDNLATGNLALVNSFVTFNHATANGGGIENLGQLAISGSYVSANTSSGGSGGGIDNALGTLVIANSNLSSNAGFANGGAISNTATATLTTSTFNANSASNNGGALYNAGVLKLANSTLSNNTANNDGGGLFNSIGSGVVVNSTFSGDSASSGNGGAISSIATLRITNTTIDGNSAAVGGGLDVTIVTEINNSIVAGNTSSTPVVGAASDIVGTVNTGGSFNNLIGAGGSGGLVDAANGNLVNADPIVGPLQNNGGRTLTMALLPGSPAINAGSNSLALGVAGNQLGVDQRGAPRIAGGRVDLGAYEYVAPPAAPAAIRLTVNSLTDAAYVAGRLTLRQAINLANGVTANVVVGFASGLGGTITLTQGQLEVTKASGTLAILGPASGNIAVSGNNNFRVLQVDAGASAAVANLSLVNGKASVGAGGGGILNNGALLLIDVTASHNAAVGQNGGGINNTGTLTVDGSTIASNSSDANGGGIENVATLTLIGSRVSANSATDIGGGIDNAVTGRAALGNAILASNSSLGNGGGAANAGVMDVAGTTFDANSTINNGGAIFNTAGLVTINSTLTSNIATNGAGLWNSGTASVINSTLYANAARSGAGGGIYNGGALTATNATITANSAVDGGGIFNADTATSDLLNNTIVARNTFVGVLTASDLSGIDFTGANNLIGTGGAGDLSTSNLIGIANPLLGPLQINGGSTDTLAPLAGSRAINAGSNALAVDSFGNPLATDQRGAIRIQNGIVDIGAVES